MQIKTAASLDALATPPRWLVRRRDYGTYSLTRILAGLLATVLAKKAAPNVIPNIILAAVPTYEAVGIRLWLWLHGYRGKLHTNPLASRLRQAALGGDAQAAWKLAQIVAYQIDWLYDNNAYQAAYIEARRPQVRVVTLNR